MAIATSVEERDGATMMLKCSAQNPIADEKVRVRKDFFSKKVMRWKWKRGKAKGAGGQ